MMPMLKMVQILILMLIQGVHNYDYDIDSNDADTDDADDPDDADYADDACDADDADDANADANLATTWEFLKGEPLQEPVHPLTNQPATWTSF